MSYKEDIIVAILIVSSLVVFFASAAHKYEDIART